MKRIIKIVCAFCLCLLSFSSFCFAFSTQGEDELYTKLFKEKYENWLYLIERRNRKYFLDESKENIYYFEHYHQAENYDYVSLTCNIKETNENTKNPLERKYIKKSRYTFTAKIKDNKIIEMDYLECRSYILNKNQKWVKVEVPELGWHKAKDFMYTMGEKIILKYYNLNENK